MDIGRAEGVGGPNRIEPSRLHPPRPAESSPLLPADRLDIADVARLISEALAAPALRLDRMADLRRQIDAGTYATDAKLARALENFARESRL